MNINNIPKNFLEHIEKLLGKNEFNKLYDFLLNQEIKRSVTLNSKANASFILNGINGVEKVKLTESGYYIPNDFKIGESILNHAGVIYSQDSSAMIPVEIMGVKPGDVVLDLCAAPGGKSVQILNKLKGSGLLISNEIETSRAKILFENITRMGYKNCIITNSSAKDFKASGMLFDKILIDAPCSGEGLIAKSKSVVDWKPEYIESNSKRQLELLNTIKNNLKDNGVVVYSTCTFNIQENEQVVCEFLKENKGFKLVSPTEEYKRVLDSGIKISDEVNSSNCLRCYPHKNNGSGQFVAIMKKESETESENNKFLLKSNLQPKEMKIAIDFLNETLEERNGLKEKFYIVNNTIYLLAENIKINNVKVLCNGCVLGEINGKMLKPNHSFFKQYGEIFKNKVELSEEESKKYIQGNQIIVDETIRGYGVFLYKGFVLGGFKASGGRANNLYPKYLRN